MSRFERTLDSIVLAFRRVKDVVTGDYLRRIERRMERIESLLAERSSKENTASMVQTLFDQNQERILADFERRYSRK